MEKSARFSEKLVSPGVPGMVQVAAFLTVLSSTVPFPAQICDKVEDVLPVTKLLHLQRRFFRDDEKHAIQSHNLKCWER